jgi:hypothetical protein
MYNSRRINTPSFSQLLRYSSGWLAQYEVHPSTRDKVVAVLRIPIDQKEVWLQMWHSLFQGKSSKQWYLQFPISISPDCKYIAILRTVYAAEFCLHSAQLDKISSQIRLEEISQHFYDQWRRPVDIFRNLRQSTVAADLDISSRFAWNPSANLYYYWIFFDLRGRFAFLIDQVRGEPNCILVFNITSKPDVGTPLFLKFEAQRMRWLRPVPIHSPISEFANRLASLTNFCLFWSINRVWSMAWVIGQY